MRIRTAGTVLTALAGLFLASPPAVFAQTPSGTVAASQASAMVGAPSAIEGTWVYAKDPTGVVPSEAIYEGSTINFGSGGAYAFQLGGTRIALTGNWKVTGAQGNTVRVHTEYGKGRRNDLTLTLRRDPQGKVVGIEVREGDGSSGVRFYVPRTS